MNLLRLAPREKTLTLTAGSEVPEFSESAVHRGAIDALDAISRVLGFSDATKATFLAAQDGKNLRNILRAYVAHGIASEMES